MDYEKQSPWLKHLGLTAQLMVMIAVSLYGGIKLDEKLKLSPLFTITFPMLVLTVSFYKLIKETNKKNGKQKK